ncbi:LPS-assembly protein LptD [Dyella lutea]|uniref:LPS-assembly protein LptD n=1 Tax=Dyella lutea TaxID=2950441 RepID=A0ABT1FCD4_9GAMM|nr:LPS assembly protein LptD [Dyella lutea]MCP1373922.1 LPS assembly protein LptD [Dyella lutea]
MTLRPLPPRRLLAVAAALALLGAPLEADAATGQTPIPGNMRAPEEIGCPLGSFFCPARPISYAMCRPNALLSFYDPTLPLDSSGRDTANTDIHAERADSSNQSVYRFTGEVRMQRADQLLRADRVDYNDQTTDYDARGNVRYQEAGELLSADRIKGNNTAKRGVADNVTYQLLQSRGNGVAKQAVLTDAQHSHYRDVTYSTCDVGHRLWEFSANRLTLNRETGVGVAHGAVMRFADVPFFYLPYLTFPIDNRRKSGFLAPTFGNSSHSGVMVSAPYYLNLAPNYDATLEPRLYSKRGAMLAGQFRYLLPGTSGHLDFEYVAKDHGPNLVDSKLITQGKQRYLYKFGDATRLWPGWVFTTSVNRVSDKNYLRDFSNDLYTNATNFIPSNAYVRGSGNWWSASLGVDAYQNTDPYLNDNSLQYRRWPRGTLNLDVPLNNWLEFGMNNEAVAFRKSGYISGNRADLYPYLEADWQGAAWFVRPRLAYRYTAYQLDDNFQHYGFGGRLGTNQQSPFTRQDPTRSLPVASLDTGLIFDRSTSLFGTSYTQTLEPRLYYLYIPYRNQDNLPLFDTRLMNFDYWQLFSPNQYSGADRQMNANNLTGALTTRLLDDNGVERFSASLGQIRYFDPQRVKLPGQKVTDWTGSDYVAQAAVQLNDQWRASTAYQWSPNTRQVDLGTFQIQRRIKTDGVLNFSYRFRRTPGSTSVLLEQYDASTVYPVSDRWRLLGRWTYSVKDRRTVEALAGVQYESCCVIFSVVGRHYVSQYAPIGSTSKRIPSNNAVMFELQFKGLGAFNGQVEDFFRRAILGYQ